MNQKRPVHTAQLAMSGLLVILAVVLVLIAVLGREHIARPATLWNHAEGVIAVSEMTPDGEARIEFRYPTRNLRRKEKLDAALAAGEITEAAYAAEAPEIVSSTTVYHASVEAAERLSAAALLERYPLGRNVQVFQPPSALSQAVLLPGGWTWFMVDRIHIFIAICIFAALFLFFLSRAGAGKVMYLRRVAGLDALEEAIGRATEMGKPVLYVPGLDDIDTAPTIASMVVLGHVAGITAEYDTPIIVPCRFPVIMSVAEEAVRDAHIHAGKADRFNADNIRYLSGEQFAYTSAINGIILRERPATNLYMGHFYAESLILVETGHYAGSIQVAGTDSVPQIPFFIAACDYTLIGEEFFAASAYLSRAADVLASIKAVDWFKALMLFGIVVGSVLYTWFPSAVEYLSLLLG